MKCHNSKFNFAAAMVAALVITSGTANADNDNYRPVIWTGLYAGAHIGHGSLDANVTRPDLRDYDGKCKHIDGNDAPKQMVKLLGKKISGNDVKDKTDEAIDDHDDISDGLPGSDTYCSAKQDFSSHIGDGAVGGVHLGYNIQRGRVVFGIEGDYTKTTAEIDTLASYNIRIKGNYAHDIATGTKATNTQLDTLASVRGRLGYTSNKTLLYVTGGIAWAELDINTEKTLYADHYTHTHNYSSSSSSSESVTGYVIGAGAEHMIVNGFSLRGEVLHYEFDDKGYDFNSTVVRGGFSMHLN